MEWWEEYTIRCKTKEEYDFWRDVVLNIRSLKENLGEEATIRVIEELALAARKIEDERFVSVALTADEMIRAIERERRIKEERERYRAIHGKGLGGRKSKIKEYMWYYNHAKTDKEKKEVLEKAKRELSRTSFWRLKKALESNCEL